MRFLAKLSIPSALIVGIILGNFFLWRQTVIGSTFLLGYILLIGFTLGRKFFPGERTTAQTFIGSLILISLWAILGGAIFYLDKLDAKAVMALLLSPLLLLWGGIKEPKIEGPEPARISFVSLFSGAGLILLEFAALFLLVRSSTASALRSPWERVPDQFFLIFFLASLGLLLIVGEKKKSIGRIILTTAHIAIFLSVAITVFDAGFGFDPFVHRATENYILEHGTVAPKPPYYAGEYALIVFLARAAFLPLEWINKLFLPLLAAISVPFLVFWAFEARAKEKSAIRALAPLAPFIFFLFPASSFISTTPQGLANLFLIFAVFAAFAGAGMARGLPAAAVFCAAALITHPLAGILAVIFLTLLILSRIKRPVLRRTLLSATTVTSSIVIPLIFVALSSAGGAGGILDIGKIFHLPSSIFHLPVVPFRFDFFLDVAYLYKWNIGWLMVLSASAGYYLLSRHKVGIPTEASGLKKNLPNASNSSFILCSFAVFVNSLLISSVVSFPALIDYEQGVYAGRLRDISILFLLPLAILGIAWFYERAKLNRVTYFFAILLLPAMLTASLYMTYPRTDKYESTHGYNTSQSDINAVRAIESDAGGEKYIVLSNQATGAAALQEFGFNNFYKIDGNQELGIKNKEIYFYSVPTGGPLYPYYLKMVYEEPSRETMNEAMDLARVKLGYIAISHYWTGARRLTEDLAAIADKELIVDGGRVYIYKFKK